MESFIKSEENVFLSVAIMWGAAGNKVVYKVEEHVLNPDGQCKVEKTTTFEENEKDKAYIFYDECVKTRQLAKQADEAKQHLIKHLSSVADVRCVKEEMDKTKEVFLAVLGEDLIKRVTFISY